MNAIVKKAFAKLSELPLPLQKSVAQRLLANVEIWQALRRDASAGFAQRAVDPFNAEEIKKEARRRLRAARKRNARS